MVGSYDVHQWSRLQQRSVSWVYLVLVFITFIFGAAGQYCILLVIICPSFHVYSPHTHKTWPCTSVAESTMLGPPMGWPLWNPGKHCVNFSYIWIIFKHCVNARWATVCPLLLPWVGSKSQESWVLIGFACNVMYNQGIKSLILWGWCFSSGTLQKMPFQSLSFQQDIFVAYHSC